MSCKQTLNKSNKFNATLILKQLYDNAKQEKKIEFFLLYQNYE